VGFRVAVGEAQRGLVTCGYGVAAEREAGRVEMVEALVPTFLGTDREGQLTQQPITAIGVHRSEGTAECKAVAHLRADTCTAQQIEGLVGTKLGREGQRSRGKAQPIEAHPGPGVARRDLLLCLGHEARVDPLKQASILAHRRTESEVIEAFDAE